MAPTAAPATEFRRGRAPGRPTKIDQVIDHREVMDDQGVVTGTQPVTVADRIVEHLLRGSYLETAAAAAGVARETLNAWLRGAAEAGAALHRGDRITAAQRRLMEFSHAIDQAQAEAEQADLSRLDLLADGKDPAVALRAVQWRMERRRPKRWGPRAALELTGPDGGAIQVDTADARTMIARELERMADRLGAAVMPPTPDMPGVSASPEGAEPEARADTPNP